MALRLVRENEQHSHRTQENTSLREAIARLTIRTTPRGTCFIFTTGDAEALYRTLSGHYFSQSQLDQWVTSLLDDHPHERRRSSSPKFGVLDWVAWIFGGENAPPKKASTETILDWMKRVDVYVNNSIESMPNRSWLERPLSRLDTACEQVASETGRYSCAKPLVRWALVQLLTIPTEFHHATG
jgi:hypothetical protein